MLESQVGQQLLEQKSRSIPLHSLNHIDHLEDLLAASIPTFLPANGIRICQGVEVGKQLKPFALLLRLAQLLHTTGPPSF